MKILIKLLTVFAILCTVACSQTFEDVSNNNLSSNSDTKAKGQLAMNVGSTSRTIANALTNADISSAELTANDKVVGNWSGNDVIGQIENDKSIILDVDYYDFVLSVKNEAGKTLATAQTSKYIDVGTNHISLSLKNVTTGEGSFEVTFSWQSDYVSSVKAGLYDCETDEEFSEMTALTVTDKTAVYSKEEIPVGQYMLMLNFYDNNGGLLKTYTEVLRVEAYRKTTATRQFAGFNTEHTIEYVLTESWKSDFTLVTERNAAEEVELPTIENIDTEKDAVSYILKWYTTETFETGTEIKKIEAGTDKDMKLYGQIETCYRTTADGFLKTIQSLTVGGPHNVIVTGELTSSQLSTMATYIKNYSTRKINLDLSETTGLTYINSDTFQSCTGLVNIVIPDSVTGIDWEAFENCSSLKGITIPDGVTRIYSGCSFIGCSSLTAFNVSKNNNYYSSSDDGKILYNKDKTTLLAYPSATGDVTISDSVTSIGEYAFYNCSSLTSVTIGDSVTTIGSCAFYNCSSLTSVTIGNGVTSIRYDAFTYCSSLENVYITDLTAWMNIEFYNSYSNPLYNGADLYLNGSLVTDLVIPAGMTSIGSNAFYNYDALTSVVIPDSVTSIGSNAFYNCDALASVTIPDGVTYIGEYAFSGCDNLEITIDTDDKYLYSEDGTTILLCDSSVKDLVISENVASVQSGAFACCRNVETIVTGDTLMSLSGLPITSALKSITIGNGVTSIGERAFSYYDSLESVTIGNGVTSIGWGAFLGCESLISVVIPDSVASIGENAFNDCSNLASVTIGNNVASIGGWAFEDCSSLASVYITDLTAWKNIEFYNSYSNPLYYGAKLYLNGSLAEFTVTFDAAGGSLSGEAVQTVKSGESAVEPIAPSKNGYVFCGWYTSAETLSSTVYNFDTVIKKDITLYAKWVDETVGYIAYSDGTISIDYDNTKTPIGIVIEATDGTATKIVSLTETTAQWSTEYVVTNATSETDGMVNMTAIQSISDWEEKYPAFKWCDEYTDRAANSEWYLPAKDELEQLYSVKEAVNAAIEKITAGDGTATSLSTNWYWSSSQSSNNYSWVQRFSDGYQYRGNKNDTLSVRAVRAF